MTKRFAKTVLLLAVATVLSYALIAWMASLQIDPIRMFYSPEPEFRHHGKPYFHLAGAILWLQILAVYSALCSLVTGRLWSLQRSTTVGLGFFLFLTAAAYVLVCHPLLLPVILSGDQWERYYSLAERLPMLREIYFQFGLPRLKYHVLAGQVVLTVVTCLLAVAEARWRARPAAPARQTRLPAP